MRRQGSDAQILSMVKYWTTRRPLRSETESAEITGEVG